MTALTEREEADVGNRALKLPGSTSWCWQTITALQFMWENLEICLGSYIQVWHEAEEHAIWEKIPPDSPFGSKDALLERLRVGDENLANAKVAGLAAVPKHLKPRGGHLRRIARDHPEIHRRMVNGEFKSVSAAAREAGILRQRAKSVSLTTNTAKVAANIKKHYTPEQVQALKDAL